MDDPPSTLLYPHSLITKLQSFDYPSLINFQTAIVSVMDNPESAPLTQADINLLRSFISRLPAIAAAPVGQHAGNNASISAPAARKQIFIISERIY